MIDITNLFRPIIVRFSGFYIPSSSFNYEAFSLAFRESAFINKVVQLHKIRGYVFVNVVRT